MFGRRWNARRSSHDLPATRDRRATSADVAHLTRFAATHPGVEAYLEPQTSVTALTVVLVAPTGEWTRRRVEDAEAARRFTRKRAIPIYDATVTGYPPRMRAWTAAHARAGTHGPPGLGAPGSGALGSGPSGSGAPGSGPSGSGPSGSGPPGGGGPRR